MFLVCGFTYKLNSLEIPYSITLVSDENFKVTIKNYNEPHSLKVLKRVFDCIIFFLLKNYQ